MKKVALVDDHILLRSGLASVIGSFEGFEIVFEADNGKEFIEKLQTKPQPDIVLLDISMPVMNGFETAQWINKNLPEIKVIVLSMMDDDTSIIRMIRYGARGYLLKDSKPAVLKNALNEILEKGYFFNDLVSGKMVHLAQKNNGTPTPESLTEKEIDFLKLCCTEKAYKEIATEMNISPRAVETLRSNLFDKLNIQTRVGLVLYTIKQGIIKL
ncbi:MAG: response regulator transcription factor [Bacteroidetes bacterium]|nr:response regulator transcription factor [Bacteroidota bacterium]